MQKKCPPKYRKLHEIKIQENKTKSKTSQIKHCIWILFFSFKWYIYVKDFMASHDKYGTVFLFHPFVTAIIRFSMNNSLFTFCEICIGPDRRSVYCMAHPIKAFLKTKNVNITIKECKTQILLIFRSFSPPKSTEHKRQTTIVYFFLFFKWKKLLRRLILLTFNLKPTCGWKSPGLTRLGRHPHTNAHIRILTCVAKAAWHMSTNASIFYYFFFK